MKKPNLPENDGRLSSGFDMSHREIAEQLGVSKQTIQQTEQRALSKFEQRFCDMFPDTWKLIQEDIVKGWFGKDIENVNSET